MNKFINYFQVVVISLLVVSAMAASFDNKPPAAILRSSSDQKLDGSFAYKYGIIRVILNNKSCNMILN